MDRFNRIYRLHLLLKNRHNPIARLELEKQLDCSSTTLNRIIQEARLYLSAPIIYDRKHKGYCYEPSQQQSFELPSLWFNSSELLALLTSYKMLEDVQPGMMEPQIAPLKEKIKSILGKQKTGHKEIATRIRILQSSTRTTNAGIFQKVASGVVSREQLKVLYHGRDRDAITERWISPQRLVFYKDNWYLDAWCHLRKGLRSFSLDRIHVIANGDKAKDVSERKLDEHFVNSYGIFSGKVKHKAVLRFSSDAARWVADEIWHPDQKTKVLKDGSVELTIPYSDPRELMMDILKYSEEVEVLAPKSLRKNVAAKLAHAAKIYQ